MHAHKLTQRDRFTLSAHFFFGLSIRLKSKRITVNTIKISKPTSRKLDENHSVQHPQTIPDGLEHKTNSLTSQINFKWNVKQWNIHRLCDIFFKITESDRKTSVTPSVTNRSNTVYYRQARINCWIRQNCSRLMDYCVQDMSVKSD